MIKKANNMKKVIWGFILIKNKTKIKTNNISRIKNKMAEISCAKLLGNLTFLRISDDFFVK